MESRRNIMGNEVRERGKTQYKYATTREKYCFGIGAIGKMLSSIW